MDDDDDDDDDEADNSPPPPLPAICFLAQIESDELVSTPLQQLFELAPALLAELLVAVLVAIASALLWTLSLKRLCA